MRISLFKTWLLLLLMCGLIGGDVAKVTDYTFAAVADDRPNFPLSRPALDESGVVRLKSSALRGAGGVRPSKCVPDVGGRAGVRADFKTCKTRYDALSPAELAQWTTWADEDDMDVFQFFMRTCQVYEWRSMGWPPAAMDAWKGWVCKIYVASAPVPVQAKYALVLPLELEPGPWDVNVAMKVETDCISVDSAAQVYVHGEYDDGFGLRAWTGIFDFGCGSQAWAIGTVNVPDHDWIESVWNFARVEIFKDKGAIWVDEFSVVQDGVELNSNPHFNGGWNDVDKLPVGYDHLFSVTSGGVALMYLEDVP